MSSKNLTRLSRRLSAITGWSHQRSLQALSAVKANLPPSTDKEATEAFLQNLAKGTLTSSPAPSKLFRELNPVERLQLLVKIETLVEPDDYLLSSEHDKGRVREELDDIKVAGQTLADFFATNPRALITWSRRNHRWDIRADGVGRSGFIPGTLAYSVIYNYLLAKDIELTEDNSLIAILLKELFITPEGQLLSPDTLLQANDARSILHSHLAAVEIKSYFKKAELSGYFDSPSTKPGLGLATIPAGKLAQLLNDYYYPYGVYTSEQLHLPLTERPDYISPQEETLELPLELPSRAKGFERYKDYYRQRAQDLVGEYRALGNWGPAYEILSILHETDSDIILTCESTVSGERFPYELSSIMKDPPAIQHTISYKVIDGTEVISYGIDTLYATSAQSAAAAVRAMLRQQPEYESAMKIETAVVIKLASHKGGVGTSMLAISGPTAGGKSTTLRPGQHPEE